MKHFQKLADSVDILPLLLALKRRPELWKADTYLRKYPQGPFGAVESIMLRFPEKAIFATQEEVDSFLKTSDQHENVDYPAYKTLPEARPLVMALMSAVGGERLGRVILNKIVPGGSIFPHVDSKAHAEYYSRFHIVLQSKPGVIFRAGDEQVYMPTGSVWWFNNAEKHEVINDTDEDRIHLVIDIRTSR